MRAKTRETEKLLDDEQEETMTWKLFIELHFMLPLSLEIKKNCLTANYFED